MEKEHTLWNSAVIWKSSRFKSGELQLRSFSADVAWQLGLRLRGLAHRGTPRWLSMCAGSVSRSSMPRSMETSPDNYDGHAKRATLFRDFIAAPTPWADLAAKK